MKVPCVGFLLAMTFMAPIAQAADQNVTVPPYEAVGGQSQSEWSRAWWQWAGSFEYRESPVADRDGSQCGSRQSGPVWFLAGTYGSGRTVRTCTVPAGKYLFFPLVNYVVMPPLEAEMTCEYARSTASRITDVPMALILEVDGKRVENLGGYRQATLECFDMGALAVPKAVVFPSAANGYYVMLKPLPPGKHEINFGGMLPGIQQAVTYTLQVE
ncbi:MAG: hypothetical protein AB7Q97_23470 [Gammaproteobacteria bacterium]